MIQSGGYLTFNGITVDDAGRYLCTAVNAAGKAEGVAEVVVNGNSELLFLFCIIFRCNGLLRTS